jgi:hypothetical protein
MLLKAMLLKAMIGKRLHLNATGSELCTTGLRTLALLLPQ